MRWLLRLLDQLLGNTVRGGAPPQAGAQATDDRRAAAPLGERGDVAQHDPGQDQVVAERTVTRHNLGPPASSDGVGWEKEQLKIVDGVTPTVIEETTFRLCDCGIWVNPGNNVKGVCSICGRITCELCHAACDHCGAHVCKADMREIQGRSYCLRHAALGYWSAFWRGVE